MAGGGAFNKGANMSEDNELEVDGNELIRSILQTKLNDLFEEIWAAGCQVDIEIDGKTHEGFVGENIHVREDSDRQADIEAGGGDFYDANGKPLRLTRQVSDRHQST